MGKDDRWVTSKKVCEYLSVNRQTNSPWILWSLPWHCQTLLKMQFMAVKPCPRQQKSICALSAAMWDGWCWKFQTLAVWIQRQMKTAGQPPDRRVTALAQKASSPLQKNMTPRFFVVSKRAFLSCGFWYKFGCMNQRFSFVKS